MHKLGKIICCAVLCVPLIAAIVIGVTSGNKSNSGLPNKNNNYETDTLVKVKIHSEDGTLISEYDSPDVLQDYFSAVNNGMEITEYQPIGDEVTTTFIVNLVGSSSEAVYTFVMSSDNIANCIYKDIDEKIYSINSEDAKNLLMRDEFATAHKYEGVVNLQLSYTKDSELLNQYVSADTYNWNYTRLDGEIITKVDSEHDAEIPTVTVPKSTSFDIFFDSEVNPETVNVTVTNGSEVIYSGEPGALSTYFNFNSDTLLGVNVDAKWHESDESDYYGEVNYVFNILYDVPSVFTLVDKSLAAGEFTVIKVSDGIATSEIIKAQSEIMPGVTDSFVFNGSRYIYIPIKPGTAPGTYTITLEEFAGTSTVEFTVKAKTFAVLDNLLVSPEIAELSTSANVTEYTDLLEKFRHFYSSEQLWKDKFMMPVDSGKVVCAFGDTMNIPANIKTSDGMYISGVSGSSVRAANDGKVVFAGQTKYSGNTVIIDHGLGVLSYYFNLGGTGCAEGDIVTKGSAIGTVGSSGYTPYSDTVLYANSVGGCFINPDTQLKYGIYFG